MDSNKQLHKPKETKNVSPKQLAPHPKPLTWDAHPAAIIHAARADPKSLTQADVLQLHRTIGNRAVGQLMSEIGRIPYHSAEQEPVQRQGPEEEEAPPNKTGMPDHLKLGIENISGMDLSGVRVHYNSSKPKQVNALAYTQGQKIHVAPGQEKHLPHEGWHAVQQMQERVKPTRQMKDGVPVNDDEGLEHEADVMGAKALTTGQDVFFRQEAYEPGGDGVIQKKYPTQEATPRFYDNDPTAHPEYPLYHGLMASLGFPADIINTTWNLLLQGFREQYFIQHQLEQLENGEDVALDQGQRNIIRNDNICFQEVATIMSDYLFVGDNPLALWSGGIALSPYALQRGYVPLEETPLGMVINQIEFHRDWILQAPLWNILSTVFVRQQPPAVHVLLRTFEADAVLFRQEIPVIREIFPNTPIYWHAIYTLEDGSMLEINNNLALEEAWTGFTNEDSCVQALLEFYLDNPNQNTERGLGTILTNLPPQPDDYI